ncbi:MAG: class I SAM-dependent methyltransferase [Actinomycetota bacterium]|jgi:ubiquinone/menaquinone biosynthesis C-methylase UbiE|nr:class I SAM-dependent methyltransferase [Actinomycetota bacterium]
MSLMAMMYDRMMTGVEEAGLSRWRAELLGEASGATLELGAGTGRNLAFYPDDVSRLVLAEPDRSMRTRLRRAVVSTHRPRPVEVVDAPAEALPFEDASFDTVVATLVLCSVRDPERALCEVRRVLRPEGRFLFIEHVAAEDRPPRLRWQQRVEPVWRAVAGNCHLTRRTETAITAAGLTVERVERASMRKAPSFVRPTIRGSARVAA